MSISGLNLVDLAVTSAELMYGRKLESVPQGIAALSHMPVRMKKPKAPKWTLEEEDFLRSALGHLPDDVIAARLGRSVNGVHIHWERDMGLPAPSKAPNVITAQQAAKMLGVDSHKTAGWVDYGLIAGRLMAGKRRIRLIDREAFMRWACNPEHWVYFNPRAVSDPKLRRLIRLRMKRWGDQWWTARQVAEHHGVHVSDVKRYIKAGKIQALRPPFSRSGRHHKRYWGLWFVRRSEATRPTLEFIRGRGAGRSELTAVAMKWIRKARRKGLSYAAIGRTMKRCDGTVSYWVHKYGLDKPK